MEYITSIDNTPYMRWQAALLLESFRMRGMEDKLLITCAEHHLAKPVEGRVLYHDNVGQNYACLNRAKGILEAVKRKEIKQPFVSIDPDTFMIRPIDPIETQVAGNDLFYASYDNIKDNDGYDVEEMFGISKEKWPGLGTVYHFNDVPETLFQSIYDWTEKLSIDLKGKIGQKSYWQIDITAYNVAFVKNGIECTSYLYESPLDPLLKPSVDDVNFVHYCNGVLPGFNKRHHNAANWFSMNEALPFETILKISKKGKRIKAFKKVVRCFLNRKPDLTNFLIE